MNNQEAVKKELPVEIDVQLTKDNVLVIFHDYNLKRMTNKEGIIQELNYQEINKYRQQVYENFIETYELYKKFTYV